MDNFKELLQRFTEEVEHHVETKRLLRSFEMDLHRTQEELAIEKNRIVQLQKLASDYLDEIGDMTNRREKDLKDAYAKGYRDAVTAQGKGNPAEGGVVVLNGKTA